MGEPDVSPMVTCTMVTYDRVDFVRQAIRHFEKQHYPSRELVIVDDGPEGVEEICGDRADIRYIRCSKRLPLGVKRNMAVEHARGEIIVRWDDDDWHAPWRLINQVRELREANAVLCGLTRVVYYDPVAQKSWLYRYNRAGGIPWVCGATFCYRRSFWEANPFSETLAAGGDNAFLARAEGSQILALDDPSIYIALMHGRNIRQRSPEPPAWQPYPVESVRDRMGRQAAEAARQHCEAANERAAITANRDHLDN